MFEFFYKRGYLVASIILFMFVFGMIGLFKMPKNLFPDANRPEVVVFSTLPGASPEVIANSVSKPIEEELATLSDVYEIKSSNVANFSIVHIVFDYSKSLNEAAVDVTNALNRVKSKLPKNVTSSIYLVGDFTLPVDVFSVSSSKLSLDEVRKIAENFIKPKLLANKNIGNVDIFGGYESAIRIDIDVKKLKKYHIPLNLLIKSISSFKDVPIGFVKNNYFFTLTFYGQKKELIKLKELFIAPNIKLKDIANISYSHSINHSLYIGNSKNAIAIAIQRPVDGSVIATSNAAREIMNKIKKAYPNLEISIADTQRDLVELSNKNMLEALRDAIIFTLIVILLFLGNLRAIIAAALSIPMVFFGTLAFLYLTGSGLNIVIYTAIILALGMLVDDAVVVLENIERHLQEGDKNAIYNGTKEVIKPVFAGTIATIAILFPLMYVGGFPEKIFRPLIETTIVALVISYFLSITFIPKLALILYKNGFEKTKFEKFFEKLYQITFGKLEKVYIDIVKFTNLPPVKIRRMLLMFLMVFTFVMSVKNVIPLQGRDTMPPMDTGIIKGHIEFGSNFSVDEVKKELAPLIDWLNSQNWVKSTSFAIGTEKGVLSIGGGGGENSVNFTINAIDRFHRSKTIWQLEDIIREHIAKIPNIKKFAVFDFGATPLSTVSAPLDIQLRSDSFEELPQKAKEIEKLLYNIRGLKTIYTSWDKDFSEYSIKIDLNKALSYGLTPVDIISQIVMQDRVVGLYSKLSSMNTQFIRVRFKDYDNFNLTLLPINTKKGVIPLSAVATIKKDFTFNKIERYNLEYAIDVQGYRATRAITKITSDSDKILHQKNITNYYQNGDVKVLNDSFKRMIKAILIGVIILTLTLMVVYQSLRLALIMIFVLPLSMIGAAWGLLIANKPSCMPSMMGVLLLFGIIIKNAVLLIDFYKEYRKENAPFDAAIKSIEVRFRPVMMTAFGTIAGMIPIALEWAIGLERLSPIADVAIGGLIIGTFLTLIYVPMLAYATDKK